MGPIKRKWCKKPNSFLWAVTSRTMSSFFTDKQVVCEQPNVDDRHYLSLSAILVSTSQTLLNKQNKSWHHMCGDSRQPSMELFLFSGLKPFGARFFDAAFWPSNICNFLRVCACVGLCRPDIPNPWIYCWTNMFRHCIFKLLMIVNPKIPFKQNEMFAPKWGALNIYKNFKRSNKKRQKSGINHCCHRNIFSLLGRATAIMCRVPSHQHLIPKMSQETEQDADVGVSKNWGKTPKIDGLSKEVWMRNFRVTKF